MKMLMKMSKEENEERYKKLDVDGALLDLV
jgi:hypothetical protein